MSNKIRVLSGIRASHSSLHLGNLLGAIEGMIKLQNDGRYETFYMVADLHGMTTDFDPEKMRENRMDVALDYLAAGIDPKKSTLFLQSDVSEHAEFSYYLSSTITNDRLMQLPAYKEKKEKYKKHPELMTLALLTYPVLMAADILLYKAGLVPIAKDQLPHLEIARYIARKMNKKYNTKLLEPRQFSAYDEKMMVPSIIGGDPGKMSKSKEGSAIFLSDSKLEISNKISKMLTDGGKGDKLPEKKDNVYQFFTMVELFLGDDYRKQIETEYLSNGVKYGKVKEDLIDAIYQKIRPIQERRVILEKNPKKVKEILRNGANRAKEVANETINEVKDAMGLPKI